MPNHHENDVPRAILQLACEVGRLATAHEQDLHWRRSHCEFATKDDLEKAKEQLMGDIEDLSAGLDAVKEHQDKVSTHIDNIKRDAESQQERITKLEQALTEVKLNPQIMAKLAEIKSAGQRNVDSIKAVDDLIEQAPPIPTPTPDPDTSENS